MGQQFLRIIPNSSESEINLLADLFSPEDRVQLITDMEALHTFSGIINRTRRRDIGEFTIRKPQMVEVALTAESERTP